MRSCGHSAAPGASAQGPASCPVTAQNDRLQGMRWTRVERSGDGETGRLEEGREVRGCAWAGDPQVQTAARLTEGVPVAQTGKNPPAKRGPGSGRSPGGG